MPRRPCSNHIQRRAHLLPAQMADLSESELPHLPHRVLDPAVEVVPAVVSVDPGRHRVAMPAHLDAPHENDVVIARSGEIVGQLATVETAVHLFGGLGKRPIRLIASPPCAELLEIGQQPTLKRTCRNGRGKRERRTRRQRKGTGGNLRRSRRRSRRTDTRDRRFLPRPWRTVYLPPWRHVIGRLVSRRSHLSPRQVMKPNARAENHNTQRHHQSQVEYTTTGVHDTTSLAISPSLYFFGIFCEYVLKRIDEEENNAHNKHHPS